MESTHFFGHAEFLTIGDDFQQYACVMPTWTIFRAIWKALSSRRKYVDWKAWCTIEYDKIKTQKETLQADMTRAAKLLNAWKDKKPQDAIEAAERTRICEELENKITVNDTELRAFPIAEKVIEDKLKTANQDAIDRKEDAWVLMDDVYDRLGVLPNFDDGFVPPRVVVHENEVPTMLEKTFW